MTEVINRHLRSYHEQYWYAKNVLEKFLEISNTKSLSICEVGPAEGGALKYFAEKGHRCYGVEFSEVRYNNSKFLNAKKDIHFVKGDITEPDTYMPQIGSPVDIIICRDVIEHIDTDQKFIGLQNMSNLLKPGGKMFISFPPKYSPYAGHQQVAPKILVKLPYLHLLPDRIYIRYLSIMGMRVSSGQGLLDTKHKRLSIRNFEKMIATLHLNTNKRELFLIRPCYESRFHLRRMKAPFSKNMVLREYFTLGALYCLTK
ncbi:class I SAM-dependent methyltransferase [bacterium]|nr:class I SAM-dependent methyltransferase [bacterium]MBU1066152.1 class I SAM-dependent methyltransferase [bacterium]MBU1635344.1 class I SAM-dependent methyltransferase [bacterium]MBU1873419.1 class I SAM-dependent methyltransferase [bacterium]